MLQVYNSFSRKKEVFQPLTAGRVTMYVCGPTVYDVGHLGHGRSAVSFDLIRRYLIWKGLSVKYVSNFTDIDDKMINRAAEKGITVKALAELIGPEYERDFEALRILKPDVRPCATEQKYINGMIEIISKLEKKGAAYVTSDGVYFDISKFVNYGKLSNQKLEELNSGARVEVNTEKRNPQDFVLWKLEKPGEPAWESPWGRGRPGWHIECSAMSSQELGETIDIHGGGADLMFPHHECEIAQSEMASGKQFVRYWLHNGFINVNEEKMSKSLGNFVTLKDVFVKYDPRIVRFAYLQTHYRNPISFDDSLLEQAKNALERLDGFVRRLESFPAASDVSSLTESLRVAKNKFEESMDDDFETSEAFAAIFELMKEANIAMDKNTITVLDQHAVLDFLKDIDRVFAILPSAQAELSDEIAALIQQREEARKNRDFASSDRIRDELLAKGIELEDTPRGTVWKRV
ncbi:MAG: cysteine--tRNA ligase [Patescibacteria group bacterium]